MPPPVSTPTRANHRSHVVAALCMVAPMIVAWASDLHLDHVSRPALEGFLGRVREVGGSAALLLLGGDISSGLHLISHLSALLDAAAPGPVRLVLGNHEAYHDSLAGVRQRVGELVARSHGRLVLLDGAAPESLGEGVWLTGVGGWGDARAGGTARPVPLNDEELIDELSQARAQGCLSELLGRLGQEAALALACSLEGIPADARRVLVLTHVPPFAGAAWHRGRPSEPAFQQRFCWAAGGEVLSAFVASRPEVEVVVLCGHTHGGGFLKVSASLSVVTAPAEYGAPRLTCFAADAPAEQIARAAGALATGAAR